MTKTPRADIETSELAGDDEQGESGESADVDQRADSSAPHTLAATVLPGSGEAVDLEQYAAVEAARHLDDALKTLVAVMQNPNRNAQVQLMAAREVINLALKRNPEAVSKQGARVYVLDQGQAAEVVRKRLGLR